MKELKFSGRELATLRALDFSNGSLGSDLLDRTRIMADELAETLHGLMEGGYVETNPPVESLTVEQMRGMLFEVNPGYVQELKLAIRRA